MSSSQEYMRKQKDECSFVSLRDVERTLTIFEWFYTHQEILSKLLSQFSHVSPFDVSLVLSLGVTYYVKLDCRSEYKIFIAEKFRNQNHDLGSADTFARIIDACQDLFINELRLEQNIAKNDALKENVWMMIICIELKIPLFLVGKPGSSKSLAKTVVLNALQGKQSYSDMF